MASPARVSVCIPARDEATTIGPIVEAACQIDIVDEVLVLDHHSTDTTAATARHAGATVFDADDILSSHGPAVGKGDVLWRSLAVAAGDIVVWIDADLSTFTADYVTGLVEPFADPTVQLVRSTYGRSLDGIEGEGGRVTELTARPLLMHLRPDLAHIRQPLGGEYAIRASAARSLSFEVDYGVEAGVLLDVADRYGISSIAQADLGIRGHRHRPLAHLHEQARQVSRAILCRNGHPDLALAMRPPLADLLDPADYPGIVTST